MLSFLTFCIAVVTVVKVYAAVDLLRQIAAALDSGNVYVAETVPGFDPPEEK